MGEFEFVFSLFGLVLGFTLVEVLSGFVRTMKLVRTRVDEQATAIRLGWLTPLLALFILMDVSSYWINVWDIRQHITVGNDTIYGGLFITGIYYFAASMAFPDDASAWPDLDRWFWLHRRQVLVPLAAVNLLWVLFYVSRYGTPLYESVYAVQALYFSLLFAAVVATNRLVVAGSLAMLSLTYLSFAIAQAARHFS